MLVKSVTESQGWWCEPVSPSLGRQRQEEPEVKANLGYVVRKERGNRKGGKGREAGKKEEESSHGGNFPSQNWSL